MKTKAKEKANNWLFYNCNPAVDIRVKDQDYKWKISSKKCRTYFDMGCIRKLKQECLEELK